MANFHLTNIHTRKIVTEKVIFHNLHMSYMYNKKKDHKKLLITLVASFCLVEVFSLSI